MGNRTNQNKTVLYAGYAKRDITPKFPCAVQGQFAKRIANSFEKPMNTSVIVMETRLGDEPQSNSVWVSLDLGIGHEELQDDIAKRVAYLGIDPDHVMVGATHTHDAMFTLRNPLKKYVDRELGNIEFPSDVPGLFTPEENYNLILEETVKAIEQAWSERKAASVGAGRSKADIGHCRYVLLKKYTRSDESQPWQFVNTENHMGGYAVDRIDSNNPKAKYEFIGFTGVNGDDTVEVIGFWDNDNKLIGMVAGIHAPAQTSSNDSYISPDIWGFIRENLDEELNMADVPLVSLCLFAGDVGVYDPTENPKERKRSTETVARKVTDAILAGLHEAEKERNYSPKLVHTKFYLDVPLDPVSEEEYKKAVDTIKPDSPDWLRFYPLGVIDRYERMNLKNEKTTRQSFQAIKLGEIGVCTAPYEIFVNYSVDVKEGTKKNFKHVLPVQLVGGHFGYLPNEKALAHPTYGMGPSSGTTGPEGGHMIVDALIKAMKELV